jgi:hypothetical protein
LASTLEWTADTRDMCVRVDYPLEKPLMPQLMVKIKGHGQLPITLRYENVSQFCFSCGHIGHTAMNCEKVMEDDHDVRYGEELHASPPRRVKEIVVRQLDARVARPLFQVLGNSLGGREVSHESKHAVKGIVKAGHAQEQPARTMRI